MTDDEIDSLIDSWILDLEVAKLSPRSIRTYERGVDAYLEFCEDEELDPTFDATSVKHFVVAQTETYGRAVTTARTYIGGIKRFVAWAIVAEPGRIPYTGVDKIASPTMGEVIMPAVPDDVHAALLSICRGPSWLDRRDEAILRMLDTSGTRASELMSMNTPTTDLRARRSLVMGKGRRERLVTFTPETALALDRYKRARPAPKEGVTAFWLSLGGRKMGYPGLDTMIRRRCAEAGVAEIHAHMYRHRWARHFLREGGDRGNLKLLGGWRSDEMVEHYTREDDLERALAAADRMYAGATGEPVLRAGRRRRS